MTGNPHIVDAARRLRRAMSLPEVLLWGELRLRPGGLKFRRQHAVGDYVLDFYCASAKIAIEVDGRAHDGQLAADRDTARDFWLAEQGIRSIRITASNVLENPASAALWLITLATGPVATPLHHRKGDGPPPRAGEDQGSVPCR